MKAALVVVDVQNDFLPGGALAVGEGDQVVPVIEALADDYDLVVTTGDAHPEDTKHFEKWPVHCVANTRGAELDPAIEALSQEHFWKGESHEDDGYSGFEGYTPTGHQLADLLREQEVEDVTVVGLALDYCVQATALDSVKEGFETTVLLDGTRPVDGRTGDEAVEALRASGVTVV